MSTSSDREARQWAMYVHFSVFLGYLIPMAGLVAPIVIWQLKKDEYPFVDVHGKIVVNGMISLLIYALVCGVLSLVLIGIVGLVVLGIAAVVFPLIGGVKANNGEIWPYPFCLTIVK